MEVDLSSGSDSDDELHVNQEFAKKFKEQRQKAELHRRNNLLAEHEEQVIHSDSEEEDEDGELLTPQLDEAIHNTLYALKTKNPKIYEPGAEFIPERVAKRKRKRKEETKERPLSVSEYMTNQILGGHLSESEEDDEESFQSSSAVKETRVQKQKRLKKAFSEATKSVEDDSDDDFLSVKVKSASETAEDEKKFQTFSEEYEKKARQDEKGNARLAELYKVPLEDGQEEFLRDFFVNEYWRGKNLEGLPVYHELARPGAEDEVDISEDEEFLDAQDDFEREFNFRYQEPGADQIMTYSRDQPQSLRRKGDKRKRAREAKKLRKQQERVRLAEEVKRLKNLKRREIEAKIKTVSEVSGTSEQKFNSDDFEDEFDPQEHDKRMSEIFDDDYYAEDDMRKPVFSDLEEDDEQLVVKKRKLEKRYDEQLEEDEVASAKKYKELEGKLNQLYKLDYEGMAGGMKTRFKYTPVNKESFGQTVADILNATDKELNQRVGLKLLAPYRDDGAAPQWWKRAQRKLQEEKHEATKGRDPYDNRYYNPENNPSNSKSNSKSKKKKKKQKNSSTSNSNVSKESASSNSKSKTKSKSKQNQLHLPNQNVQSKPESSTTSQKHAKKEKKSKRKDKGGCL